jgi:hypothetical protein
MIIDGRSNTNCKVLIKGVGEHLLPTAQAWGFRRPGLPVGLWAPETVISTCSATSFQARLWSHSVRICCVGCEVSRMGRRDTW